MDLFTYLMAKNDHNTSVNKDLFSYLLGKGQSGNYQTFTGTSISANNTKKGKMKLSLKGNTSQTGTPTPSTPIPINVVSGDNTLKVEGKNLFDKDGTDFDGHIGINNFNGKQIASNTFVGNSCYNLVSNNARCQAYFKGTAGTTYYVSFNSKYEIRTNKAFGSDGIITDTLPSQNQITMTTDYVGITLGKKDSTDFTDAEVLELKNSMQIEKGNSSSQYEPYQSQTYPISLSGTNYFDKNSATLNYRIGIDGQDVSDGNCYLSSYIKVDGNTTYIKNQPILDAYHRVAFYTSNTDSSFISKVNDSNTFTTPATAQYLRICGYKTEIDDTKIYKESSIIELCKIGDYQDYFTKNTGTNLIGLDTQQYKVDFKAGDKITISNTTSSTKELWCYANYGDGTRNDYWSIGANATRTITLAYNTGAIKWGTAISGGLAWVNSGESANIYEPYGTGQWCKYNAIGNVVLDGSETWGLSATYTNNTRFNSPSIILGKTTPLLSNYFLEGVGGTDTTNIDTNGSNGQLMITIPNNIASTIPELQTWLGTHNTIVDYVLDSPYLSLIEDTTLIEQLDNLEKAMSYKDQTNISQVNNDLPFEMEAEIKVKS